MWFSNGPVQSIASPFFLHAKTNLQKLREKKRLRAQASAAEAEAEAEPDVKEAEDESERESEHQEEEKTNTKCTYIDMNIQMIQCILKIIFQKLIVKLFKDIS